MKRFTLLACLLLPLTVNAQDTGLVYFYRVEEAPRFVKSKPKLRINGTVTAVFPEREFIGLRLKPGRHVLTLGQPQSATALVVEAGRTYYVQVSYTPGGHGFNGLLDQIFLRDEAQALLHFEQMKQPLEGKNIKRKDLEIIKEKPKTQNAQTQ